MFAHPGYQFDSRGRCREVNSSIRSSISSSASSVYSGILEFSDESRYSFGFPVLVLSLLSMIPESPSTTESPFPENFVSNLTRRHFARLITIYRELEATNSDRNSHHVWRIMQYFSDDHFAIAHTTLESLRTRH